MGIYSKKFLNESAVADTIQDPNNPGNDLDQIEKDICGPQGIEAHSDEIEDAQTGVVGDPLEEAYVVMYESEYNFNQLMQCIGIAELSAVSNGRDVVFEAADKKGFLAKVKEILKSMFAKITSAFKNVIADIQKGLSGDKKFVTQYKQQIVAGSNTDWSFEGYDFKGLDGYKFEDRGAGVLDDFNKDFSQGFDSVKEIDRASIIKTVMGTEGENPSEAGNNLMKQLTGDKKELKGSSWTGEYVCNILGADSETKAIKEAYGKIKASYEAALKLVQEMDKGINAKEDGTSGKIAVATYYTNVIRFRQSVENVRYAVYVKVAKAKRNQARRMATMFKAAAPANVNVQHNSADMSKSMFGSLNFV